MIHSFTVKAVTLFVPLFPWLGPIRGGGGGPEVTVEGKPCCLGGLFSLPQPFNELNAPSLSHSGLANPKLPDKSSLYVILQMFTWVILEVKKKNQTDLINRFQNQ